MRRYIVLLSFFAFASVVRAQHISFCEKIDEKHNPVNISDKFEIGKKGGYLDFYVSLPGEIGHDGVIYDLFWVDKDGREQFDNTVKQTVNPIWMSFWKQIDFYHPGTYRVYVYNDHDQFLCAGEVTVVMK